MYSRPVCHSPEWYGVYSHWYMRVPMGEPFTFTPITDRDACSSPRSTNSKRTLCPGSARADTVNLCSSPGRVNVCAVHWSDSHSRTVGRVMCSVSSTRAITVMVVGMCMGVIVYYYRGPVKTGNVVLLQVCDQSHDREERHERPCVQPVLFH